MYVCMYDHNLIHLNNLLTFITIRFDHTHCSHLQGKDLIAFAPFGHGRRKCPGYHFTYVEVGVFLTILLQKFTNRTSRRSEGCGKGLWLSYYS